MKYIVQDVVIEKHQDGNAATLSIRRATKSEPEATAVGTFSFKIGNCRIRITPAPQRSFAQIGDSQEKKDAG
jgi:hypothetical protein